MKEVYLDTETTGLDPAINGIWQIAGMIVSSETFMPFDYKVAPFKGDIIEPTALEMSGMSEKEMFKLPHPIEVHRKFTELLGTHVNKYDKTDKYIFLGYNARFDSNFLREWFAKCGDKYFGSWFWTPPVDLMSTAAFFLANERPKMPNFKLESVMSYLGITIDGKDGEFHAADVDVAYTYKLALYLRKKYPGVGDGS
jgi:DNA polymerase III subunit epsilon